MDKTLKPEKNYVLVDNVIKTFKTNNKKKIILSNVNFQISKGEFTCILGPSGCGKSTLLDLLAGFTKPDEGLISVSDEVVRKPGPERGFVFQKNSLIPWQTLEQNVGYGLKLQKFNSKDIEAKVTKFLKLVGLEKYRKAYPNQLSGGMQQRGSIIRALITNPKIILMDEPFGAVDAQTRSLLQEMLLKIWREFETTVVFVTHDVDEAILLADRVIIMGVNPGHIREIIPINIPRPRSLDSSFLEEFQKVKIKILNLIKEETLKLMQRYLFSSFLLST